MKRILMACAAVALCFSVSSCFNGGISQGQDQDQSVEVSDEDASKSDRKARPSKAQKEASATPDRKAKASKAQKEAEATPDRNAKAQKETKVEEVQPIGPLFDHDFIVKYHKYSYDVSADFKSVTRREEKDAFYDIKKEGDTMTIIIKNYHPVGGPMTTTTVYKADENGVKVTSTKAYEKEEYRQIMELMGTATTEKYFEGKTLAYEAESFFLSEEEKGKFVYGSKNPQYEEDMDVVVSDGPKMFGRATKEYIATPEAGSLLSIGGYKIKTRRICDAERFGTEYICYKSLLAFADGEEHLGFEVTDFQILK